MNSSAQSPPAKKGRRKTGTIPFPRHTLKNALRVANSIWYDNGGQPFSLNELSKKLGVSTNSSGFGNLIRASKEYGLTKGAWSKAATTTISITSLGQSIVVPQVGVDSDAYKLTALLTPFIFRNTLEPMNNKPIPDSEAGSNTLALNNNMDPADARKCYDILMKNIEYLGLTEDRQGKKYLALGRRSPSAPVQSEAAVVQPVVENGMTASAEPAPMASAAPKPVFVAHGKNQKPLEQMREILRTFKIDHEVAVDEPHGGRPISQKVAELMKGSSFGIFIFTADESAVDDEGREVWRPSQNVVYELGAASVLYGGNIIICKEKDVSFASDFSDLGYITFDKDELEAQALPIVKELAHAGFQLRPPSTNPETRTRSQPQPLEDDADPGEFV